MEPNKEIVDEISYYHRLVPALQYPLHLDSLIPSNPPTPQEDPPINLALFSRLTAGFMALHHPDLPVCRGSKKKKEKERTIYFGILYSVTCNLI